MLFKLETRERLGRHTHESLLSFPTKGNQFSSLKEPVRYCVSSALRPSAYARLRHHKSIFDEWTLSFPLFLFILIYLYRFWLVFSLYLLRENGAFSLLFRSSLTVPCGWLWLVVLLPCHWEFTSSREIQTLGNAFDVQVTPSTLIEEQYGTPLLNHYAMHTLDGRIETSQFPGIHPLDECYAVTWKIYFARFGCRFLQGDWRMNGVLALWLGGGMAVFLSFLEAIYPCRNGWDIYIPPLFF